MPKVCANPPITPAILWNSAMNAEKRYRGNHTHTHTHTHTGMGGGVEGWRGEGGGELTPRHLVAVVDVLESHFAEALFEVAQESSKCLHFFRPGYDIIITSSTFQIPTVHNYNLYLLV